MEDFNQYLNDDSSPEEREAARKIQQGLSALRIQERVKAVAAERAALHRRRIWRWAVTAAVFVVMTGAVLLFWNMPAPITPPSVDPIPGTTPPKEETKTQPPTQSPAKQETAPPPGPIAQAKPEERLPNPRYPAPAVMMRGNDTGTADDKQALLNQLWYTDYPLNGLTVGSAFVAVDKSLRTRDFTTAYINLQRLDRQMPKNDTLLYLKAYCLMEMGQGAEALPYFESLQGHSPAWDAQLEWYRGLSLLQSGQKQAALSVFEKMASRGRPPYRAFGKKAVEMLKR